MVVPLVAVPAVLLGDALDDDGGVAHSSSLRSRPLALVDGPATTSAATAVHAGDRAPTPGRLPTSRS